MNAWGTSKTAGNGGKLKATNNLCNCINLVGERGKSQLIDENVR